MSLQIQGVLAALVTPRRSDGSVDLDGLGRNIDLVYDAGGTGVVLTGGTGEYYDLTLDQRKDLIKQAKAMNAARGTLICANGAGRLADSVALGEHALSVGVDALLLPPPHFYRYEQQDLDAFFREAARRIDGPVMIYNLASFTTPIEPETIVRLMEQVPNIVGVKDSSGNLDSLEALAARPEVEGCRVLGHDRVYVEALRRGLIDAVISGPASVIPEVSAALFKDANDDLAALFHEALDQVDALPYPWALKVIAEARGLFQAGFPLPASEGRRAQIEGLKIWLPGWLERLASKPDPAGG